MKKLLWNQDWSVSTGVRDPFSELFGGGAAFRPVTLPQDAMILEKRDENSRNGTQTGFYPSKSYTYQKEFFVPRKWRERQTYLEFEGVMSKALVYLNGELAGKNKNGYSQFYVDLNRYIRYGERNTVKVIAINQEQSSRWYSGSGIYRNVNLHQGGLVHIRPEGVRITTEEIHADYAKICVETTLWNAGAEAVKVMLSCGILDAQGKEAGKGENMISLLAGEQAVSRMKILVDNPRCWSPEQPTLYRCVLRIREEEREHDIAGETFGIRTVAVDARGGLRINGEETKLRGACIHHDNGIIGATTLYQAEEFRLKKLKEAGFNSIRSAHHPAGKAILEICDRLGILVMDELTDMWDQPKNCGDFAIDFGEEWKSEMERMVAKDYNHPSVILYSLGNEIPEIGRPGGGRRNRELAAYLHSLDASRFVTGGFSGFLAVAPYMGEMREQMTGEKRPEASGAVNGQKREEGAEMEGADLQTVQNLRIEDAGTESVQSAEAAPQTIPDTEELPNQETAQDKELNGSEGLNMAMGKTEQEMLDAFSVSPLLSQCLEEASCELDVVGYNYLTARHEYEHTLHPDRVVVGSETYPPEIARLWKIVRGNSHVIGDFTWTGYDYLGEAGIGIFHYGTELQGQGWYPDRLAYCGDININGYRRPASYLREIVYGLRKEPWIGVERVDRYGLPRDNNGWKYFDGIDSWTFTGLEGRPAKIHVLSSSREVELFLNGVSLGRKEAGEAVGYDVLYETAYQPGELLAVGYTDGREDGRFLLTTAQEPTELSVSASCASLTAGEQEIAFLTVDLLDENGLPNRWEQREVSFQISGQGSLAGVGSADPGCEGDFWNPVWKTFDGRVMAAVRSGREAGSVSVRISAEGCGTKEITFPVLDGGT